MLKELLFLWLFISDRREVRCRLCGTEMSKYAPNKQHNQRNGFECLLGKVGYDENT